LRPDNTFNIDYLNRRDRFWLTSSPGREQPGEIDLARREPIWVPEDAAYDHSDFTTTSWQ
jgi:hypothetical protein